MAIGNPINLTSNVEGKNISVIATAGQTQFTVTGGYRINQISVFRNGVRLVDGRDFTAADGATVTLLSAATVADVLEFQVFDDFRVSDALNVNSGGTVNGDVTVTGIVSTTNLSIGSSISLDATSGIVTAVQFIGQMTGTATTATNAEGLTGTPDITVNNIVAAAATFSGVLTYEDVTNVDSLGIVTARTGVDITANGLVVNAGVSTFGADLSIADKIIHSGDTNTAIRFPSADTFTVETAGVQRLEVDSSGDLGLVGIATATGLVVVAGSGGYAGHTGIITAVTFDGNLTGNVTGAVDLNGGVLTLDADADTTITADTDDQIDIAFGGNDRITLSTGLIDLKNDGSQSAIRLYCESSNAHYAALQAPAHSAFSGNITLTLPATTDTLVARTTTDTLTNKTLTDPSITDKIIHSGDTNTAIRFPAADTFTVETGGSEALRVDSGQRLLIGTTSGTAAFAGDANNLVIVESGNTAKIVVHRKTEDAYGGNLRLGKTRSTTSAIDNNDEVGVIEFFGHDSTDTNSRLAYIGCYAEADGANNDVPGRLVFATTADGASSPTERARITSGGVFLMGATASVGEGGTPADLNSTEVGRGYINIARDDTAAADHILFGKNGAIASSIGTDTTNTIVFKTGTTEAARFDSSQRLLVGATAVEQIIYGGTTNSGIAQQTVQSGDVNNLGLLIKNTGTTSTVGGTLSLARARSTANAVVNSGDVLGAIQFLGGDGTDIKNYGALVKCEVDGSPGANDMPGRLVFATTADGAQVPTDILRINAAGRVSITNASGSFANLGEGLTIRADSNSTSDTSGLHIMNNSLTASANAGILFRNYDNHAAYIRSLRTGGVAGRLVFGTNTGAGTPQSNISTKLSIESKSIKFQAFLEEQAETRSNDISNDANFDVVNGNILYYEGSANGAAAQTINIRGNSSTTYNAITSTDFVASLTVIHQPNSSEYVNAISIDGTGQTVEWLGGSAPDSASSSAYEAIHITIIKLGNASYKVLASVNEYD